jgi:hypothetical protein
MQISADLFFSMEDFHLSVIRVEINKKPKSRLMRRDVRHSDQLVGNMVHTRK